MLKPCNKCGRLCEKGRCAYCTSTQHRNSQYILDQCIPVIWTALTGIPGKCLMWQGNVTKINKQEVPIFPDGLSVKHWLWVELHHEKIPKEKLWSKCGHTICVQPSHLTKTKINPRN